MLSHLPAERDIKVARPLYSVEVTETETAKFETEISEADVHGNWKLKGEPLHQSNVSGIGGLYCPMKAMLELRSPRSFVCYCC
jgi:hypothetical protein